MITMTSEQVDIINKLSALASKYNVDLVDVFRSVEATDKLTIENMVNYIITHKKGINMVYGKYAGQLVVELMTPNAKLPEKSSFEDLGYDLFASENRILLPGMVTLIPTGIKVIFPKGFGGRICDRSGIATNENLEVRAGVIDSGYRGEIKIAMFNSNTTDVFVPAGKKIAQMLPIELIFFDVRAGTVDNDTARGESGFGSTGIY